MVDNTTQSGTVHPNYFVANPLDRFFEGDQIHGDIPDAELERLKAEISVERLVEASGVELKPAGKACLAAACGMRTARPRWS